MTSKDLEPKDILGTTANLVDVFDSLVELDNELRRGVMDIGKARRLSEGCRKAVERILRPVPAATMPLERTERPPRPSCVVTDDDGGCEGCQ